MKGQPRKQRERVAASESRKHMETMSAAAVGDLRSTSHDISTPGEPSEATSAAPSAGATSSPAAPTLPPESSASPAEAPRSSRRFAGAPVAPSVRHSETVTTSPPAPGKPVGAPSTTLLVPAAVETSLAADARLEHAGPHQVSPAPETSLEVKPPAVLLATPVTALGIAQEVSGVNEDAGGPTSVPAALTRTGKKTIAELEAVGDQQAGAMSHNAGEPNPREGEKISDMNSFDPTGSPTASLLIFALYSIFFYVAGFSVAAATLQLPGPIHLVIEQRCAHTSAGSLCFFAQGIRSISAIGVAVGCILGGTFADYYGRKTLLCLSDVFLFCGILLPHTASDFPLFCISRAAFGVGLGGGIVAVTVFVVETVPASSRGLCFGVERLIDFVGRLSAVSLAATGSECGALCEIGVPTLVVVLHSILLLSMAPESPRWLVTQRRSQKAIDALLCFGDTELHAAETVLRQEQAVGLVQALQGATPPPSKCCSVLPKTYRKLFSVHRLKLRLIVACACLAACVGAALFEIFPTMANKGILISQDLAASGGVVQALGVVSSIALVDCWGRNPTLKLGTIGVAVGFSVASVGCFWQTYFLGQSSPATLSPAEEAGEAETRDIAQSAAIIGVLSARLMQNFSWSTLLPLVVSEVLPTSVRATGAGLALGLLTVLDLAVNLVVACFSWKYLAAVVFAAYALLSYVATGLLTLGLGFPEAKGRRLEDLAPEIDVENLSGPQDARCCGQAGSLEESPAQENHASPSQAACQQRNFALTSASTVDEEAHSLEVETATERQQLERELAALR